MNINTVTYIARNLNKEGINWCIGASVLLHFHGLVDNPDDMDILVATQDYEKTHRLLESLGEAQLKGSLEPYLTEHFINYKIMDQYLDVMSGFKISHEKGVYEMLFDAHTIVDHRIMEDCSLPLSSLEDWFVLYQLMPGREKKVALIENHLRTHGITHRTLLERALNQPLPPKVEHRIKQLLEG